MLIGYGETRRDRKGSHEGSYYTHGPAGHAGPHEEAAGSVRRHRQPRGKSLYCGFCGRDGRSRVTRDWLV